MCTFTWCALNMVQWLGWWWLYESKHVATFIIDKLILFWLNLFLNDYLRTLPLVQTTHWQTAECWIEDEWKAIRTYFITGPVIRLKKLRKTTEDPQSVQTASLSWLKPATSQMQLTNITAYTNLIANFTCCFVWLRETNGLLRLKYTKGERDIWTSKIRGKKNWRKLHNVEYFIFIVPCIITFYEITNRRNCMQSILFHC